MTNNVSLQDGGHQLHCASKGVLHLESVKKVNKHWKLKVVQEKESVMGDRSIYRKISPLRSLFGTTWHSLVVPDSDL